MPPRYAWGRAARNGFQGAQEEPQSDIHGTEGVHEEQAVREELSEVPKRVNTRQQHGRDREKSPTSCSFGPSFDLPFRYESDDEGVMWEAPTQL
ncbi:Uncharacterized protein HZ326_24775 [Fusarium oxysporum f. sp. albedinis]|nr:Uncharacterized protein HZ326_24775 [Fusarium oxysporum f. sp. albedinis]KAK2468751.1 hypothetical protein H9L39_19678 [Fusarium oxysporum f. sp. albedinis]